MELVFDYLLISSYVWGVFILLSGGFYVLSSSVFEQYFPHLKIFKKDASEKQVQLEIKNSIRSIFIINIMALGVYHAYQASLLQLNNTLPKNAFLMFTLQFLIMHTIHDAYFYWTHKWMHEVKWMRKWHHTHHLSHVPTPFSAFNFSWQEASIHALFFVIIAFTIPMHWAIFSYFYAFLFWINVFGHMNFDFWPQGLYRWPYGSLFMTPTHHSFHHEFNKGNYGLYYRFWDDLCGTINKKTYPHFYQLKKSHRPEYTVQIPTKRPLPNETIGLYFEQIEQFNEDPMINWDFNGENILFHHAGDDGTSSLNEILKTKKIQCKNTPNYTPRPNLNIFQKVRSVLRLYSRIPHTCSVLLKTKSKDSPRQNISIYFSKEESRNIFINARNAGVNAFFISSISKLLSKQLGEKKQMWMIPVNTNNPGEQVENEVSNVDVLFKQNVTSALEIKNLIRQEIESGMIYSGKFLFKTLEPFGKLFFTIQVWLSQYLIRRTGCFSNLGKFELSKDLKISFCPPPQRGCCFSVGFITVNDHICMRIGVHRQIDFDLESFNQELRTLVTSS